MKNLVKVVAAPAAMLALMAAVILISEGTLGFRVFLNLEALAIVLFGTAMALLVSYPMREISHALGDALTSPVRSERSAEILDCAAGYAVTMGWIGTLLGVIMILSSVNDIALLPRRLALSLDALMFGLMISKLFLAPSARRLSSAGNGG